ncbi:MAG: hypothetical protein Q9166_005958 [cf. Caloplaca sp. 2 TL-2023]
MPPSHILAHLLPHRRILLSFSLPTLFASATMSTTSPTASNPPIYTTTPIPPPSPSIPPPTEPLPRMDPTLDSVFYSQPRFVTHIDDAAIARLREYYRWHLWEAMGRKGRILDLCASWVSHFPREMEEMAKGTAERRRKAEGGLEVVGVGMNQAELEANPALSRRVVQDLNENPRLGDRVGGELDVTTCVVSIDYLTRPIFVLSSIFSATKPGGAIHLVISNRCFPTKVAGDWLRVGEEERLQMVGRYLWWAGWTGVEIVDLCARKKEGEDVGGVMERLRGMMGGRGDPLWVVRGWKGGEREEDESGVKRREREVEHEEL